MILGHRLFSRSNQANVKSKGTISLNLPVQSNLVTKRLLLSGRVSSQNTYYCQTLSLTFTEEAPFELSFARFARKTFNTIERYKKSPPQISMILNTHNRIIESRNKAFSYLTIVLNVFQVKRANVNSKGVSFVNVKLSI